MVFIIALVWSGCHGSHKMKLSLLWHTHIYISGSVQWKNSKKICSSWNIFDHGPWVSDLIFIFLSDFCFIIYYYYLKSTFDMMIRPPKNIYINQGISGPSFHYQHRNLYAQQCWPMSLVNINLIFRSILLLRCRYYIIIICCVFVIFQCYNWCVVHIYVEW